MKQMQNHIHMQAAFADDIDPPEPRNRQPRLTDDLKRIQCGQSVLLEAPVARCLVEFLRRSGCQSVQRSEDGKIRVWRTE